MNFEYCDGFCISTERKSIHQYSHTRVARSATVVVRVLLETTLCLPHRSVSAMEREIPDDVKAKDLNIAV
jgi:hypothetical protein